ncbi:MAG: hypothetical protein ACK5DE_10460 [Bacteroidota bacterium]|jgi:hypothetical protein
MAYINQPPDLRVLFSDLDQRLRKLELAQRFTAPNVDFTTSTPSNPRIGDIFYDSDADLLKYWNGSSWVEIADNNLSPTILSVFPTLKTTNNNITYTGNPVTVEGERVGKMLTAYAEILGTTVTSWGTGQIYFTLPAGFPTFAHDVVAPGYITDNGNTYTIFGLLAQGSSNMYLWSPTSNGGSAIVDHNSPTVLDSGSKLILNGVAIIL